MGYPAAGNQRTFHGTNFLLERFPGMSSIYGASGPRFNPDAVYLIKAESNLAGFMTEFSASF